MNHEIKVFKGSDHVVKIPFGCHVNLNGYRAWMQLRRSPFSEEVLDELTTENERIKIHDGHFVLVFPHETTSAWKFKRAVFDIKVISPNGGETRMVEGRILVIPGVTR